MKRIACMVLMSMSMSAAEFFPRVKALTNAYMQVHLPNERELGVAVGDGRFDAIIVEADGQKVLHLSRNFIGLTAPEASNLLPIQEFMLQWAIRRTRSSHGMLARQDQSDARFFALTGGAAGTAALASAICGQVLAGAAAGISNSVAGTAFGIQLTLTGCAAYNQWRSYRGTRRGERACALAACRRLSAATLRTISQQYQGLYLLERRSPFHKFINWGGDAYSRASLAQDAIAEWVSRLEVFTLAAVV